MANTTDSPRSCPSKALSIKRTEVVGRFHGIGNPQKDFFADRSWRFPRTAPRAPGARVPRRTTGTFQHQRQNKIQRTSFHAFLSRRSSASLSCILQRFHASLLDGGLPDFFLRKILFDNEWSRLAVLTPHDLIRPTGGDATSNTAVL